MQVLGKNMFGRGKYTPPIQQHFLLQRSQDAWNAAMLLGSAVKRRMMLTTSGVIATGVNSGVIATGRREKDGGGWEFRCDCDGTTRKGKMGAVGTPFADAGISRFVHPSIKVRLFCARSADRA